MNRALHGRPALAALALLTVACVNTRPAPVARGDYDDVAARMSARFADEMARTGATAAAVVVVDRERVLWSETFARGGSVDAGALTGDSRFRVGSLSKLATALTAASLARAGKLDLDAPVADVLPWFRMRARARDAAARPMTTRDLLTHRSGLPSNILRGMYAGPKGPLTFRDHARIAVDETWLMREPGAQFSYSDLGYTVAGVVIEAAAGAGAAAAGPAGGGADFASIARERVFAPLGMTRTTFGPADDVVAAVVDGAVYPEWTPVTTPANGLVTTPNDLARLAQHLLRGPAHDESLREVMAPAPATPIDLDWRTGMGINMNDAWLPQLGRVYWHSGQTVAFIAELIVAPAADVAVVVLVNTREAASLPSVLAWETLALAIEAQTGFAVPPRAPPDHVASFGQDELARFAGMYPTEYGAISVDVDNDIYVGELRGHAFGERVAFVPTSRRTFVPYIVIEGFMLQPDLWHGVELSFADVDGERVLVSHQRGQRVLRGVRVEPVPISDAWRAREGRWVKSAAAAAADEQLTLESVLLRVDGRGFLMADIELNLAPAPLSLPLAPLDDTHAITMGRARYGGETVFVDDAGRLHVVGYALHRAGDR